MNKFLLLTIATLTLSTPIAHASSMLTATHALQAQANFAVKDYCLQRLNEAAYNGDVATVKELIAAGVDVNAETAIDVTRCYGLVNHDDNTALLQHCKAYIPANILDEDQFSYSFSCDAKLQLDVLKRYSIREWSALTRAACCRNSSATNIAALLIAAGAKVNDGNYSVALEAAARCGNWVMVDFLIKNGAEVNEPENPFENFSPALNIAAIQGDFWTVKKLLTGGANVGYSLLTPLQFLAIRPHTSALRGSPAHEYMITETFKLLITRGTDINAMPHESQPALHLAAINSNFEVVQVLINLGADISLQDKDGNTALDVAVTAYRHEKQDTLKKCYLACIEILENAGAPCRPYTKLLMAWYL